MANEYTESLDTLLQDTIPELPGVVRAVAERELRLTFREFFERSYAWRVVLEGLDAPAGDTPILLEDSNDGDANSDVVGILAVVYNGNPLRKLAAKPARINTTTDLPTHFYATSNPDEIKLYPPLENASTGLMDVHVALTPKLDATSFPRQITTKFYDTLRDGFLARLYRHPNKPYSSPAVAMQLQHNFKRAIGYHMAQAKQGYIDAQAWLYPSGWSPRNYNQGV
jgi:hypothetical protein